MTIITAKVIQDSVAPNGVRLTTLQLKYPRAAHAEFMTHRKFGRNASSSRAIPAAKLAALSLSEMWEPLRWGKNQSGMQAAMENLEGEALERAKAVWRHMAEVCTAGSIELSELGLHKQWANRPCEWFGHINVVVTSTSFDNWDELRDHPDAFPEIEQLAKVMKIVRAESTPVLRPRDREIAAGWHLPYVSDAEREEFFNKPEMLARISSARCARTSYMTHDGRVPDFAEDMQLFDRLCAARPLHASPTEHQGYPLPLATQTSRNLDGWRQHREVVEHLFWK